MQFVFCIERFSRQRDVIVHIRTSHSNTPLVCPEIECGKSFGTIRYLVEHNRAHTGEKPFHCYICGQQFPRKLNMKVHQRAHTREKQCSVCGRVFDERASLALHRITDQACSYEQCGVCGLQFSSRRALHNHTKTHTDDKPLDRGLNGPTFRNKEDLDVPPVPHQEEPPSEALSEPLDLSTGSSHERWRLVCMSLLVPINGWDSLGWIAWLKTSNLPFPKRSFYAPPKVSRQVILSQGVSYRTQAASYHLCSSINLVYHVWTMFT